MGTSSRPECHTVKKNYSRALVVTASVKTTGKLNLLLFNIIQKPIFHSVKHVALELEKMSLSCCLYLHFFLLPRYKPVSHLGGQIWAAEPLHCCFPAAFLVAVFFVWDFLNLFFSNGHFVVYGCVHASPCRNMRFETSQLWWRPCTFTGSLVSWLTSVSFRNAFSQHWINK